MAIQAGLANTILDTYVDAMYIVLADSDGNEVTNRVQLSMNAASSSFSDSDADVVLTGNQNDTGVTWEVWSAGAGGTHYLSTPTSERNGIVVTNGSTITLAAGDIQAEVY